MIWLPITPFLYYNFLWRREEGPPSILLRLATCPVLNGQKSVSFNPVLPNFPIPRRSFPLNRQLSCRKQLETLPFFWAILSWVSGSTSNLPLHCYTPKRTKLLTGWPFYGLDCRYGGTLYSNKVTIYDIINWTVIYRLDHPYGATHMVMK